MTDIGLMFMCILLVSTAGIYFLTTKTAQRILGDQKKAVIK